MALRTVGVKLMAEFQSYVAGMKTSSKATGDLVDDLEKAAKAGDETAMATEVFGKTAKSAAQHVEKLDREINSVEKELRQLAVAYAEAGTAAERADLDGAIARSNRELTKLKKNKMVLKDLLPDKAEVGKALDDLVPDDKFKKKFTSGIFEGFSDGLASLKGPAIAALAPMLAGVASAAIIGGAAGAGILGGLLLVAKDPRVQAAGKSLGENLLGELKKDANVFVEPVLKQIGKVEVAFHGMNDDIKHIFADSAKDLDPLVNGMIDGTHGILKGVEDLVHKGKPVVDQLGQSMAELGDATGHALSMIAGGSKPAARALGDLSENVGYLITGSGGLVRALTEVYGVLSWPWDKANDALFKYYTGVDKAAAKTHVASVISGVFADVQKTVAVTTLSAGEAAGKAGMQMQTYADSMDEASAKGRGLYDAQTDLAQAEADTTKAVKENGRTLDINSQKGRDNRKVLSDLAGKLQANYDAYVKVNGEGGAAQKVAQNNRDAFVRLASQFGITTKKAQDLATEMGLLPANKKTNFYANTHDAEARIAALKGHIGGVHGKTVTVHVSVTGTERLDALGHRIGGAATGGPIEGPGTTTSDSIPMMLSRGEHVWTAREVAAAGGQAAVSALRASVLSGSPRVMPSNFGPQKIIVENRNTIEFAGGPDAFGQLMANTLRVRPGIRQTIAKTLGVQAA